MIADVLSVLAGGWIAFVLLVAFVAITYWVFFPAGNSGRVQ